jgi:hypothetical protein
MNKGIFDIDELDSDNELDDAEDVSNETIKDNIIHYDSKKLCQIIVSNRYLNMNKDLAILAMQELSKRRQLGDDFNFEEFIEKSLEELPKINFSMPDLRMILSNISGMKV